MKLHTSIMLKIPSTNNVSIAVTVLFRRISEKSITKGQVFLTDSWYTSLFCFSTLFYRVILKLYQQDYCQNETKLGLYSGIRWRHLINSRKKSITKNPVHSEWITIYGIWKSGTANNCWSEVRLISTLPYLQGMFFSCLLGIALHDFSTDSQS